jgi:hypothetical protein
LFAHLTDNQLSKPTIDPSHLKNHLLAHHAHLETIFGNDRIVLIEGEEARHTLIEPIMKMAKSANLKVTLLSPSLAGSKQFANKAKLRPQSFWEQVKALFVDSTPKHQSVMQFLSEADDHRLSKHELPDVLMVENAQLLSIHQQLKLVEWNKTHDTKLILLGNKATLLSQQRGVPFHQLSERGISRRFL